ncbi:MAG: hypothetical protein HKN88_02565 [Gammaproteobacteria bacterium]|nr:hypothetical protein [Gammaproteobacteria bacterium]NNC96934.1 hypothetical protein [Gammaproteobacteria bacterium]NNM13349.1 hypothetical protein [Gammaproteobacteria bacterium]
MNKTIKTILIIVGVALLAYGGYMMITPETAVEVGPLAVESQENRNAYITIVLGIVSLVAAMFVKDKS